MAPFNNITAATLSSYAELRSRWRNRKWTGVAQRAGVQTRPTPTSVPDAESSGRMATIRRIFRRKSHTDPRALARHNSRLRGVNLDGTQERHGAMRHGRRVTTEARLRRKAEGTLPDAKPPRGRERRKSPLTVLLLRNHRGTPTTQEMHLRRLRAATRRRTRTWSSWRRL